jgi:hypothetical protein
MILKPKEVTPPYTGDNSYFTFIKMIETPVIGTIALHQDAVNITLQAMKDNADWVFNVFQVDTEVYLRQNPMGDQLFLTTIRYGALASPGDGPAIRNQ